jgi:hypothetical protein
LAGCGQAGQGAAARAIEGDIQALDRQIRTTQASIASARDESERLDEALHRETARVARLVSTQGSASSAAFLSIDADVVAAVVKGLLEGYGGVAPAQGGVPEARWGLRGIRVRADRDRLYVSGSYNLRVGQGECDGPVHGHLIYLEKNLLKLSDMVLTCSTHGHEVTVDVGAAAPPLPIPVEAQTHWPLSVREGVYLKVKRLDLLVPMQVEFGVGRIHARTRAVQVEAVP